MDKSSYLCGSYIAFSCNAGYGMKPHEFSGMQDTDDADGGKAYVDDDCAHNAKNMVNIY